MSSRDIVYSRNLIVLDNLLLAGYDLPHGERAARVEEVLELFPESPQSATNARLLLSGGQQQILAVAQGLVRRPQLLMLDEPSAGLSPVLVDRVLVVVRRLREAGTAVLLVEQLIEKAMALGNRVYALARGSIVLEARTGEADLPQRLEHAYLTASRSGRLDVCCLVLERLPNNLGLKDCKAFIAGASKGLGKACAKALADEGARVFICSRNTEELKRAAAEFGAAGYSAADVSLPAEVKRVMTEAVTVLGGLDCLVTNAGGPPTAPFEKASDDDWDIAYQLNLMSAVRLIREALPALKASGRGRIVNLTGYGVKEPLTDLVVSDLFAPASRSWPKLSHRISRRTVSRSTISRPVR